MFLNSGVRALALRLEKSSSRSLALGISLPVTVLTTVPTHSTSFLGCCFRFGGGLFAFATTYLSKTSVLLNFCDATSRLSHRHQRLCCSNTSFQLIDEARIDVLIILKFLQFSCKDLSLCLQNLFKRLPTSISWDELFFFWLNLIFILNGSIALCHKSLTWSWSRSRLERRPI